MMIYKKLTHLGHRISKKRAADLQKVLVKRLQAQSGG